MRQLPLTLTIGGMGLALLFWLLGSRGVEVSGPAFFILLAVAILTLTSVGVAILWSPVRRRLRASRYARLPKPGFKAIACSPSEDIILVEPLHDSVVKSATIRVRGYARTFEGNVIIQDEQGDGTWMTVRQTTAAAAGFDGPSEFSADISLNPGPHRLRVGDYLPVGGTEDNLEDLWSGIVIDLTVARP